MYMEASGIQYNEGQVVSAVVIKANQILLVKYKFGEGNEKYMLPGCRVLCGEAPKEAVRRGCINETGISIEAEDIVFVRLTDVEWSITFRARYLAGSLKPSVIDPIEPLWMNVEDALTLEKLSLICKEQIKSALSSKGGLQYKRQLDLTTGTHRYYYAL